MPDILTMAKGLTSAYMQLGAVGLRRRSPSTSPTSVVPRRPDLQQPPAGLRRGAGDDRRLRRRGLIERARQTGALMAELLADLAARHPSVGARPLDRPVRDRRAGAQPRTRKPMAPFNGTSPEMAALGRFFRQEGLYTFVRWNYVLHQPAAVRSPRPSCAKGSRSSIAASRRAMRPSRPEAADE